MGKYDDILYLPHHVSKNHAPMPMIDRAAQFAPFAALTGHSAAIKETARWTDQKLEMDDNARLQLDIKQQYLLEIQNKQPEVLVTYFKPDERKSGGSYVTASGFFKKIDDGRQRFLLTDGTSIPLDDILEIESAAFSDLFY